MLDMRLALNLLIQCKDTTITRYLTSIEAETHMYADFQVHMIAKYGKHKHQMIQEISELVQDESKTAATFFYCVEILKSQVVGIMDNFL